MTRRNALQITLLMTAVALGTVTIVSAAPAWTLLFPGGRASTGISSHSVVYDPGTNSLIVFGGLDSALNFGQTNAVLLLSNANGLGGAANWTTLISNGSPDSPLPRHNHAAVYDVANNRMIVFGGDNYQSGLLNDVWVLTNANGQGGAPSWLMLSPTGSPPAARFGHTAVYDATHNRLVIFGGDNETQTFGNVWVLSNANGLGGTATWTKLSPSGGPPKGQTGASAVYDAANNIMIVFAGALFTPTSVRATNAVWTLSHANGLGGAPRWTNIVADGAFGSPGRRAAHAAIYDGVNNRMTIFGGDSNGMDPIGYPENNDVWVLANANGLSTATWTQLHPTGATPGRRYAPAAYDPLNNRLIMFAGLSEDAQFFGPWVLSDANGL